MKMKYIPAYSPMFNPIENSFSKIKLNYRRLNNDDIINDIKMSINTLTEENLQNYYNHTVNIIKKCIVLLLNIFIFENLFIFFKKI